MLKAAQQDGLILPETIMEILEDGIELGYPDQAILDFEDCCHKGNVNRDVTVESNLLSASPQAQKYHGAVPEFDYYPEHAGDPEIVAYLQSAKATLKDFYESEWFRRLAKDKEFLEARRKADELEAKGLTELRAKRAKKAAP
ncbi:hypothetical protein COS81_03570 [candidate division WWE3 bacterium CG06_land_8_20_14_3_00_42_16]|uniref:Uncharacterized protein n=4 Tax=Katanobacteria TaxID=422282 RepID=A0A2M7AMA4_UNCKA|nr:MAG: hypothetical protein AUJ38_03040 [bacterium CG1_02_42_9]PIU68536.1 MAG: hypothetical protein COS81_03570 [candidate division WWE3 bacterium CG06_land_8_20_14_3_00_42_16]PIZ42529.1 MAG: hypothetical protein COY34_02695 [candidate division WWE3 bacterium CG_4_10_14_0_2_um_filter_42_8]PJA37161.1 MAG: hypothetical protein CO181_04740 [candidate division WWE3 bacterium CG_4_9_14_3_um_filter_43_9]PJC68518.1 MAG: hypothetical protein CO015_03685 [candidate division WWE3 bacterium CG_4_8_14_3_u